MKIINAWICIITNDNIEPVFGDINISDGTISDIKERSFDSKKLFGDSVEDKNTINAVGRVVTIPNINFHDHFYSRLAKGLPIKGKMYNFHDILKNLWWKLDRVLDEKMIRASAQMAVLESVRQGVTYFFDHHSSPDSAKGSLNIIADVLKEIGVRGVLCFEVTDRNGKALAEDGLDENIRFLTNSADENIKAILGLHASFTLADESLSNASVLLKKKKLGIHIHLCEDLIDYDISIDKYKSSPTERLKKFGLLNNKSILSHGIYLTEDDYKTISDFGCALAYNPDSNLNNAVGLPKFLSVTQSIPILAGTDGMNSNPARSLKQLFLLGRHSGMSFDEAFSWFRKTYFDQVKFIKRYFPDFTSLKKGDRADFIIWDYIPPTPFMKENFWGHFIYGTLDRPVHSVINNGKVLMREFRIEFDEDKYNKNIIEQGKRLYNNLL